MSIAIRNCRFKFKCTKKWSELTPTEISSQRFCSECEQMVFFCRNAEELEFEVRLNNCVAIERHPAQGKAPMIEVGVPQSDIGYNVPDPMTCWNTPQGAALFRKILHGETLDDDDRRTLEEIKVSGKSSGLDS